MSSSIIRTSSMCIPLFLSKRNSINRFPHSEERILRSLEFDVGVFHGFSLIILVEQSSCGWEFDLSLQGRNSGRDTVAVCQRGIYSQKRALVAKEFQNGMWIEIAFFLPLFFLLRQPR